VKTGTKGPLTFDWAVVPILHRWEDDRRHWLLIRRIATNPAEKTYYLVFGPVGTTLEMMVRAIGARWSIEEEFENGKDLGLDHYEARSYVGWLRHMTLVLLALAVLTVICAQEKISSSAEELTKTTRLPIALTVPEVRRLLGRLLFPLSRSVRNVLARELVAPMPAGQRKRFTRQTPPQLQLAVRSARACQATRRLQAQSSHLALSAMSWVTVSSVSPCPCSPYKFLESIPVVPTISPQLGLVFFD
jgi:hypothetical protein